MYNPKLTAIYIILSISALFMTFNFKPVRGASTTYNPTATWAIATPWITPTNAYTSNNAYAWAGLGHEQQGYRLYNITIGLEESITSVELGVEGYKTSGATGFYYTNNNNGTWVLVSSSFLDGVDTLRWFNVTGMDTWTQSKLSNANFAVKIRYQQGSGCYGLNAEVGLWSGGLTYVGNVTVGDILTGWVVVKDDDETNGYFAPALVENVTIHTGNWTVLRIIAESVNRPNDFKDVLVTPDHLLPYGKSQEDIDERNMHEKKADKFNVGDYMHGFMESAYDFINDYQPPPYFEPYRVHNITEMVVNGVADIKTNCTFFMGHYMLRIKLPWTSYIDHLPVRITTSGGLVPSCGVACLFIGLAFFCCLGAYVIFSSKHKR